MTLVHVALYSEARPIIDRFGLKQYETMPFKIFKNESILLLVSGVGAVNTRSALNQIYDRFRFRKAVNVGIAGCSSTSVELGALFCCFGAAAGIPYLPLSSHANPVTRLPGNEIKLVDMEAATFLESVREFHDSDSIWVFKIVSDYLSSHILKRKKIYELIGNTLGLWESVVTA